MKNFKIINNSTLAMNMLNSFYIFLLGECADLYNLEEMQNIASALSTGQLRITRLDKVESGMTKYLTRVRQNCHVVICLSTKGTA